MASAISRNRITFRILIVPTFKYFTNVEMPSGRRDTIPAKIIREIPLPIPFCVISSPIHISRQVPAVRETTISSTENTLGLLIADRRPKAIPKP